MKRLEAYKMFPLVAWVLVLGFSYYVYFLATALADDQSNLSQERINTEEALKDPTSI